MTEERRVLLVRAARDNALAYAARLVRERYPAARLAVLCQPAHGDRAAALVQPAEVFAYPGATFTPAGLSGSLRGQLTAAKFDEVLVLQHNRDGQGYDEVYALVRVFHRGLVTVVDSTGRYYPRRQLALDRLAAGLVIVAGALAGAMAAVAYTLTHRRKA